MNNLFRHFGTMMETNQLVKESNKTKTLRKDQKCADEEDRNFAGLKQSQLVKKPKKTKTAAKDQIFC